MARRLVAAGLLHRLFLRRPIVLGVLVPRPDRRELVDQPGLGRELEAQDGPALVIWLTMSACSTMCRSSARAISG